MTDFFKLYFQITFIGTRGSSYKGDIAIDNVQLTDGLCGKFGQITKRKITIDMMKAKTHLL